MDREDGAWGGEEEEKGEGGGFEEEPGGSCEVEGGEIKRNRSRGECVRMDVVSTCACYIYLPPV